MRADGVKLVDIARRFEISVYSVKDALAGRERAAGVRIKPDAGEVRRLYAEEGLEIGAIAQKLGCSIPTAKKALGDKFDIRSFHDEVIDSGALPLDVLDERIDAWVAGQKGGSAGKN